VNTHKNSANCGRCSLPGYARFSKEKRLKLLICHAIGRISHLFRVQSK
jgi:hypothetical protein